MRWASEQSSQFGSERQLEKFRDECSSREQPVGGGVPATGPPSAPPRGLPDGHEPHGSRHEAEPGWRPPLRHAIDAPARGGDAES